nr:hypothetical protein [Myxococcota bacterium]
MSEPTGPSGGDNGGGDAPRDSRPSLGVPRAERERMAQGGGPPRGPREGGEGGGPGGGGGGFGGPR